MLLSETLSHIPSHDGTQQGHAMQCGLAALAIVPFADVDRWRAQGHTVKRGCYATDGKTCLTVYITGPKGFQDIHLTHTPDGLTGRVGATSLNGRTPATAEELIRLIDELVE